MHCNRKKKNKKNVSFDLVSDRTFLMSDIKHMKVIRCSKMQYLILKGKVFCWERHNFGLNLNACEYVKRSEIIYCPYTTFAACNIILFKKRILKYATACCCCKYYIAEKKKKDKRLLALLIQPM